MSHVPLADAANELRNEGCGLSIAVLHKEIMMAKNESSPTSGRTEVQRQLRIAAVLVVVMVALGYAAIPFVDHAVSSPGAAAQAGHRTGAGVAPQAMAPAAATDESLRSHVLKVGTDLDDQSRECQPDKGINTACVYD
jgi:hypothetical protein